MGFESEKYQIFWSFTEFEDQGPEYEKTSVLVLLSGLFDRSRSRIVTALGSRDN